MSDISNTYSKVSSAYDKPYAKKAQEADKTSQNEAANSKIPGKTVGQPKLSEKAQKYYEELRSKFHNMEFILVSKDEIENAKAKASSYANPNKMVVLVDEEKIERMAEDASYRAQYEGIIEKAASGFTEFANSVAATGANVKGYGMQVNNDGTVSYFAVLEKATEAQAKRIAEKRAENKENKKAEAKKAAKERNEERIEKARDARKQEKEPKEVKTNKEEIVLTANSFEDLLLKIEDQVQMDKSDSVMSEAEKAIGQNIDFSA